MLPAAQNIGLIGALAAFPLRLAAREVERQGGNLHRGVTRRSTRVVFGRGLLERASAGEIEAKRQTVLTAGATPTSERGFLRLLGLAERPPNAGLSRQSLLDQSELPPEILDLLALFDAFEQEGEPFSFRDLILARKYAGLLAGGAGWDAIARSVHRSGPVTSLTRLSLHAEGPDAVYAWHDERLAELDGQHLLPFEDTAGGDYFEVSPDDYFEEAEEAEADGEYARAAALYRRCIALDPDDAVAAFNRANCLRELEQLDAAAYAYAQALKLDSKLVEAWFNFAGLLRSRGQLLAARQHLLGALALDPAYADAVYNLASLEYESGNFAEARRGWARYLELDAGSEWAVRATRGIDYLDRLLRQSAG